MLLVEDLCKFYVIGNLIYIFLSDFYYILLFKNNRHQRFLSKLLFML